MIEQDNAPQTGSDEALNLEVYGNPTKEQVNDEGNESAPVVELDSHVAESTVTGAADAADLTPSEKLHNAAIIYIEAARVLGADTHEYLTHKIKELAIS